jgi:uncharacterized protein
MINKLLLTVTLCFMCAIAHAQDGADIYVKGIVHKGEVHLRWIPGNLSIFEKGNQFGYKVVRQIIARDGTPVSSTERQNSTTVLGEFKALSEPEWDAVAASDDNAGVAQAAIYAEDFSPAPIGGGDPFYEALNRNEQNQTRYGFGLFAADQSFMVAGYMGLALVDPGAASAEPNGEYLYRVFLMEDSPTRPIGEASVIVNQSVPPPSPTGLSAKTGVGQTLLSLPRGDLEEHYSSFNLERFDPKQDIWVKRNKSPLLFLSNDENSELMLFNDTIEQPGVPFLYRMIGNSPFGFSGPPSNEVEAIGQTPVLGIYPDIKKLTEISGNFELEWDFPVDKNGEILKFEIQRSSSAEGGFVAIGEQNTNERTFTDPAPDPLVNYYKVVAIDKGNNLNPSVVKLGQLNDEQAPSTPVGLEASVDKAGLVTIKWTKNIEPDLKGYRVFYSNNPSGDFAQITGEVLPNTTFQHQLELKVLGKKVYFTVLATDFRENDSERATPVFVERPDVLPPTKPLLTKADPLPLGVMLAWIRSSSDDVDYHEVQRKKKLDIAWESLKKYPIAVQDTMYLDSTTTGTSEYSYRVLAVDKGGLAAPSTMIDVKPTRTNLDSIANIKVVSAVDGAQKQAKLTWEYPEADKVMEFHVYRSMDGGEPHLYSTLKVVPEELNLNPVTRRSIFIYKDKEISTSNMYRYRVLARFQDGNNSKLSRMVVFEY